MDAIESLGGMIAQYSIDQKIAVFGFGANWREKQNVSHCFPLTKDKNNVYLKGIKVCHYHTFFSKFSNFHLVY